MTALESERIAEELQEKAETFKRKKALQGKLEPVQPRDFTEAKAEEIAADSLTSHRRTRQPDAPARVQHDV